MGPVCKMHKNSQRPAAIGRQLETVLARMNGGSYTINSVVSFFGNCQQKM